MESIVHRLRLCGVARFADEEFRLKSGKMSSIYINMRKLWSYPSVLSDIAAYIAGMILPENPSASAGPPEPGPGPAICGVPVGGLPLATLVAQYCSLPLIVVRNTSKGHGMCGQIECDGTAAKDIIIVEDIVTTGCSILETVNILEGSGFRVIEIISILDREEQKHPALSNYHHSSLLTLSDLLDYDKYPMSSCPLRNLMLSIAEYKMSNIFICLPANASTETTLFKALLKYGRHVVGFIVDSEGICKDLNQRLATLYKCVILPSTALSVLSPVIFNGECMEYKLIYLSDLSDLPEGDLPHIQLSPCLLP